MNLAFYNSFRIVFDDNGNVKPCGRDAVINLIRAADEIEPEIKHGNVNNGFMNEYLIKKLYYKHCVSVGNTDMSTCVIF